MRYISWDRKNPLDLINQIQRYTLEFKAEKDKGLISGALFLVAALGFLAALSSEKEDEG